MKERNAYREVRLPEHEDMKGKHVCIECGSDMLPCVCDSTYHFGGETVKVTGIKAYKCVLCGEIIYASSEVKLIEEALKSE